MRRNLNCRRLQSDILSSIQEKISPKGEFAGTAVQEISGGLEFQFFKGGRLEKKLLILTRSGLHRYEVYIFTNELRKEDKVFAKNRK